MLRHASGPSWWGKSIAVSVLLTLAVTLAGCAASQAYRDAELFAAEGKMEEGLAKLEEAVKLDPKNIEYRIRLGSYRASLIHRLVLAGESARREGKLPDAERAYRKAQSYDPNNAMARQGLEAIVTERRHHQTTQGVEALVQKGGEANLNEARRLVISILFENPNQRDALKLRAAIDELRSKELRPVAKLAAVYRKPITLEFRDAPIKAVFDAISKVSTLNFFFDRDIRPDLKVTVLAKNTSIEDAVRLLLITNQLEQKILNENSILIYPNTPQKLKDYQTLAVRTFYLANADVKAVSNTLKTILKTQDLVVDERLGIIIMRDTPETIRVAERLVALQDLTDPEVMLEVEVMEIKRSRLLELGVRWPDQLTLAPLSAGGGPFTLEDLRNLTDANTSATISNTIINARKEDQDGNILANPRIRVRNKDKAQVLIGDRVPVITTTSTSTGFVSESVSYVDVGLKLDVEPNIYLDEEVAINIRLEVSNLVREVISKSGTLAYQIGTRSANTVLRLKDGETQILAGLISEEDRATANKIPGLGELPVLGRLFGSKKDDSQRSEIILSITPHLVRTIRRPDMITAEFDTGTATAIGTGLGLTTMSYEPSSGSNSVGDERPAQPRAGVSREEVAVASPAELAKPAPPAVADPAVTQAPTGSPGGPVSFNWEAPTQVKTGEQFSVVLFVTSQGALNGLPLLVGFDPQVLQVVSVQEGDFFKQGGSRTAFSERTDSAQGRVHVAAVREGGGGYESGINGRGSVMLIAFKAIKSGVTTKVQLLSASPEPNPAIPVTLPIEHVIKITR